MMIEATRLRNGTTFLLDGNPYVVVKYTHKKIARGGGNAKLSVRNLIDGNLSEKTLNSSSKVEEIKTTKRNLQYLYLDGSSVIFMNPNTYEQVEIPNIVIKNEIPYIKEGTSVNVLFWDDRPISVDIAPKVTLTVNDTMPGVKGNSATNMFKPATLENGLKVKVPIFIKVGDKIRVDTRTGEYMERVS